MIDTAPRRFFGLLCAHKWEQIGTLKRHIPNDTLVIGVVLRCEHCGDVRGRKFFA
jgi:hypothetical protein